MDSVGCQVPEAVSVECKVVVEGLRRLREEIKEVSEEIDRICLRFPGVSILAEHPWLWSGGVGPGVGGHRRSASVQQRQRGAQDGWVGSECVSKRKDRRDGTAGHFQEGQGPSSLHVVPGGIDCIHSESRPFMKYYTQKLVGRQQEQRDQNQNAGKACSKAPGDRLDTDEEERTL